jgi:hypothetical protein
VDPWILIREILEDALEQDPDRRAQFIADACAGDAALQREVEEYLGYQDAAERFDPLPAVLPAASAPALISRFCKVLRFQPRK